MAAFPDMKDRPQALKDATRTAFLGYVADLQAHQRASVMYAVADLEHLGPQHVATHCAGILWQHRVALAHALLGEALRDLRGSVEEMERVRARVRAALEAPDFDSLWLVAGAPDGRGAT